MSDFSPPGAVEIAARLIACRSVTPADDGALPYLRDLLAKAGFSAEIVSFAEPGTPGVDNLYARIGTRPPHFVFAGHTDVVPPGDPARWRFDPFRATIAEGMIWGRGACDMKGGLAAAVAAALALRRARSDRRLDQLPRHRRRRGAGGQRHREAAGMGARQGRGLRSLHPGRADQPRQSSATP